MVVSYDVFQVVFYCWLICFFGFAGCSFETILFWRWCCLNLFVAKERFIMNRSGVVQPVMVCYREHYYDIYDIWWLRDVKKASYKVGLYQ